MLICSVCGRKFNYQLCRYDTNRCNARNAADDTYAQTEATDREAFHFTSFSLLQPHQVKSVAASSYGGELFPSILAAEAYNDFQKSMKVNNLL